MPQLICLKAGHHVHNLVLLTLGCLLTRHHLHLKCCLIVNLLTCEGHVLLLMKPDMRDILAHSKQLSIPLTELLVDLLY